MMQVNTLNTMLGDRLPICNVLTLRYHNSFFPVRPVTIETRCFHQKARISKIPPKRFLYRSLWAQIYEKKVSNFSKTPNKIIPGPILGQDRPEKNSAKYVNSKRRDSESSTDIDRQNQRPRHEIWTGRARSGLRPTLWSRCSQNYRW